MKIAIDCRMYKSSGIGTYIREILPYLLETDNEFLLIGNEEELKKFKYNKKVKICECNIKIFTINEIIKFPIKEINKCDIFYTPYFNIPGRIKVPIFSTIHDVIFLDMPELTNKLGYIIRKIFYIRAYYLSKKIFTVSNFSKDRIKKYLGNKKEIIVTYNGVSKYILENKVMNLIKKDYFIFVGNIKKHKGLKTLLEAYKEAKEEGLKSGLVIVGNQNNFKTKDNEVIKVMKEANDIGIKFTGYITNEELRNLIGEAKALIQPSLYEGFGIPPLEAICLGTRAFITDIDVFKELYSDLDNIDFFKSENVAELKKLLLNPPNYIKKDLNLKYHYEQVSKIIGKNLGIE